MRYAIFSLALASFFVATGCCSCPDTGVNWVTDGEGSTSGASTARATSSTTQTSATPTRARSATGPVDQAEAAELATSHAFAEGLDVETYSDIVVTAGREGTWAVTFRKPRSRRYFIINVNRTTRETLTGETR